jgi:hypothetical protein
MRGSRGEAPPAEGTASAAALDDLAAVVGELSALVELSASERVQDLLQRAREAVDALRAQLDAGRYSARPRRSGLDPVRLLRRAATSIAGEYASAGIGLQLLVPARLPRVRYVAGLEEALVALLARRVKAAERGAAFTLAARHAMPRHESAVLVTLVDPPSCVGGTGPEEISGLLELVTPVGGRGAIVIDGELGRATTLELPLADS